MQKILTQCLTTIRALRLPEVLLMSGFFVIGYIFAIHSGWKIDLEAVVLYGCIVSYILSVYTLNSYCDYAADMNNHRLRNLSIISRPAYRNMTVLYLGTALLAGYVVNRYVCALVFFSFCHWILYYWPGIKIKSTVLGGTALHFVAGVLHFHIGYMALMPASNYSVLVAIYFSLLLSMGHLNHELIDYESDKANGIRNTTVVWGKETVQMLLTVLFVLSALYWLLLYLFRVVTLAEFLSFGIPSAALLIYALLSRVANTNSFLFQQYYRYVFLTGGVLLILLRIIYP